MISIDVKTHPLTPFVMRVYVKQKSMVSVFEEESLPELRNLTKITSTPPEWFFRSRRKSDQIKIRRITQS